MPPTIATAGANQGTGAKVAANPAAVPKPAPASLNPNLLDIVSQPDYYERVSQWCMAVGSQGAAPAPESNMNGPSRLSNLVIDLDQISLPYALW